MIFIFLFGRIDIADVGAALKRADLKIFLPILIVYVIFFFLWDALIYKYLFSWFCEPVEYRGVLKMRGVTYLIVVLNYAVGQGGMAFVMNRWKNFSIKRTGSVVIFSLVMDFFTLVAFSLAGAFRLPDVDAANFFDASEAGGFVRFLLITCFAFILHLAFYRILLPRSKGFSRIKQNEILASFVEAPTLRYFQTALLKSGIFVAGIIFNYYAIQSFGLRVPLLPLSVMLPIAWMIGSIPVTVMRMGTMQAAMIWLVTRYAQGGDIKDVEAAVLAFSLVWETGLNVGRFIIGAISAAIVPRSIWRINSGTPENQAEKSIPNN